MRIFRWGSVKVVTFVHTERVVTVLIDVFSFVFSVIDRLQKLLVFRGFHVRCFVVPYVKEDNIHDFMALNLSVHRRSTTGFC